MDNLDANGDDDTKLCLKSRDEDDGREERPGHGTRKSLFRTIEKKALEYGKLRAAPNSTESSNLSFRYTIAADTAAFIYESSL